MTSRGFLYEKAGLGSELLIIARKAEEFPKNS